MIPTVDETTEALDAATSALDRLDAEIRRADEDGATALQAMATLIRARDTGAFDDPLKLAADLDAARAAHDATTATIADLQKMRAPLAKRVDAAREQVHRARREAARPEAERLEAETRKAFDAAFAALARSRAHRAQSNLPCTGQYLTFDQTGSGGLADLATSHGFALEIRSRSM